ncbi:glucuronate isomerase [Maribacter halichondriae]|uniref:glucuronate isomerase n=1 Tax=Maribacter halichondriae TaxID=2980554 RepID=UPI0023589BEF|nr:glucuronate isomerase [Maribacter sp. Hal144]
MENRTSFIDENFLLQSEFAKVLYYDYAKDLPIIDYHNHLPPSEMAKDHVFSTISEAWLAGDHYKWRAMRTLGIDEKYVTGNASDRERFQKWAEAVPYTVRNPLYHWTHLELSRYFGIDELLNAKNAAEVYEKTSARLQENTHSAIGLLQQQNVESLCTTDEPHDNLEHHKSIAEQGISPKVFPAFRPDKAFAIDMGTSYISYLELLGDSENMMIETYADLLDVLGRRMDCFHQHGCRLSDHGLEQLYHFEEGAYDSETIFIRAKNGNVISTEEVHYFKSRILVFLCKNYHQRGWGQQFHLGALRDNNKRLLTSLGPNTGFDSIGDFSQARALSGFLNELDSTDQLAKTIVYNLNPSDNEVCATMMGNFNDGTIRGKMQFGSGWWYLDQKDGMERQMNTLSNMGILSTFVGMLTDSRSFLSFTRHEYFRRILCNLIGKDVRNGELPRDEKLLGKIVADICYHNAKNYFDFNR